MKNKVTQEIIRHYHNTTGECNTGGMCVVASHTTGDSFYTVATSICSNNDQYNRKTGIEIARGLMSSGHMIRIPLMESVNRHRVTQADLLRSVDSHFNVYAFN